MSDTPHSAATTVARRRSALERGDVDAAAACLSADVVLVPPLTEQFHREGPGQLRDFLAPAYTAVEDIRLHTQTGEGRTSPSGRAASNSISMIQRRISDSPGR
ncbi:nuclear transport factor 2 family protein [Streptomyces sp. NPDC050704]|uniref:nuclear transport factor 2 family protein n=1 Tax=Streptomyces sp. NPDC050704 TaxID=3157219 RepID=UPI00343E2B5F